MNKATAIFLIGSFLWVQTGLPVLAQSAIELHGTVTDETGAVILGATVTLEGKKTSTSRRRAISGSIGS